MISFLICAFNEEKNIKTTIENIYESINKVKFIDKFEIVIVNDGSEDLTEKIVQDLKLNDENIVYCKNEKNLGLGKSIKKGLEHIKYSKFMIIPADNAMPIDTITLALKRYHSADLIMVFPINPEHRSMIRNIASIIFRLIYLISFDCYVLYINAPCICPAEKVKNFKFQAARLSINSEITTKLLHSDITYCEVPAFFKDTPKSRKTLTLKNLFDVAVSFIKLYIEIKIMNKKKFLKKSKRKYIY